jgi:hypothetical protein
VVPLRPDEAPVEAVTELLGELAPAPGVLSQAESSRGGRAGRVPVP